jgi:hypothetical protein
MLSAETIRRLENLQQELADLFIEEANLPLWREMKKQDRRGDAYWEKKNARQTFGMLNDIQRLFDRQMVPTAPPPDTPTPGDPAEAELEKEIAFTEKQAADLIAKVKARRNGKAPG